MADNPGRKRRWRRINGDASESFWAKVKKTEGCWIWTASKDSKGYGWFKPGHKAKTTRAHVWSYANLVGPVPEGMCVLHNCPGGDNPSCVNPAHLWLGTFQDNARDMVAKGRNWDNRGDRCPVRKLSAESVTYIMARLLVGEPIRGIAAEHGVTRDCIEKIWWGKSWGHLFQPERGAEND